MNRPPRLVLASASPRRTELLARLGLEHEVKIAGVDESSRPGEAAAAAADRLARAKAEAVRERGALTIGCDTLVVLRGEILGKPADAEDAVAMLLRLQGREHVVFTSIAVAAFDRTESAVESTRVWFRSLDRAECEEYVATGEPMDKAGAYGIQGFGAAIVERIEGDYFNVMGLPIGSLLSLLQRFDWRYAFRPHLVPLESDAVT